jgi:hypothetical protein
LQETKTKESAVKPKGSDQVVEAAIVLDQVEAAIVLDQVEAAIVLDQEDGEEEEEEVVLAQGEAEEEVAIVLAEEEGEAAIVAAPAEGEGAIVRSQKQQEAAAVVPSQDGTHGNARMVRRGLKSARRAVKSFCTTKSAVRMEGSTGCAVPALSSATCLP